MYDQVIKYLLFIYIVLALPLIFIKLRSLRLKTIFNKTVSVIRSVIGWIIGINGPIRVGKTSFQSGLSSLCQMEIMGKIEDLLMKVKKIFKQIDFNLLNDFISKSIEIQNLDYPDVDVIVDHILDIHHLDGETLHFNMIGNQSVRKLITDYVFGFYCLNIRKNFVQSKTPIYSNVTHQFNLHLNTDWLAIRNAYKNKSYSILDWVVLLIDEATDEVGAMKYLQDTQDESGAKEYRRKFGQIHQERNWIISTKQDVMDEIKKYRNLTHTHIILEESVYTVGNYRILYKLIKLLYYVPIHLYTILVVLPLFLKELPKKLIGKDYKEFYEIYEYKHNKRGLIRHYENRLYYHKNFFDSIGYNVYSGYMLKRAEDIERSSADKDYLRLFIPTTYCWGTYDTHLYKTMQQDLLKNSNEFTNTVNPFTENKFFQQEQEKQKNGDDDFDFN